MKQSITTLFREANISELKTHVNLRVRRQRENSQLGIFFIDSLEGDGLLTSESQYQLLRQRRDAGDGLQLGLQLADGP
jgi:hypothetical protein